ncbi:MAG: WbqC family protein [Desulfobacterales bacterium]|nr:WbqC family protein [Desulfobacterales bacterium]
MIVSIHQPQYLPWLGYFDKIDKADVFCFLDNVQYKKNEWQNRNRIKTARGPQWLTVPVSHRFGQKINEILINNNEKWPKKHLQGLITNYAKASYFDDYIGLFEKILSQHWRRLSDLNIGLVEALMAALGLTETDTVQASEMSLREEPTDRLIDVCRSVGADVYLSGKDGANYMDLARFEAAGIAVVFQDFHHPTYPQLFGEFESHLSIVDLLFNCGPEALSVIRREDD